MTGIGGCILHSAAVYRYLYACILRNKLKCENWFWSVYAQLHFCPLTAYMCLSVNKGLDQTTVGCASKLGPARLLRSDQGVHAAVALVLFFARC